MANTFMISNVGERIGSEYRIVVKWPKFGLVGFVGLGSVGLGWVGLFNATLSNIPTIRRR